MTAPPPPALSRLLGYVAGQLPTEPPDGSVVRIMYGGGAFDPDYLTRADEHAALSGWPDGQHWYPIGDDEPERWNSVLNAATGYDAEIEVLRPVDAVRAEVLAEVSTELSAIVAATTADVMADVRAQLLAIGDETAMVPPRVLADRIAPEGEAQ